MMKCFDERLNSKSKEKEKLPRGINGIKFP